MNTETWIYIFGFVAFAVLLSFITWMILKIKLKKINKQVPIEVMKEFLTAESRYKQANGTKSQQDILFELAREHFRDTEPRIEIPTQTAPTRESYYNGADIPSRDNFSPGITNSNAQPVISKDNELREPKQETRRSNKPNRFNPVKF
jgi:hypothetical protein